MSYDVDISLQNTDQKYRPKIQTRNFEHDDLKVVAVQFLSYKKFLPALSRVAIHRSPAGKKRKKKIWDVRLAFGSVQKGGLSTGKAHGGRRLATVLIK